MDSHNKESHVANSISQADNTDRKTLREKNILIGKLVRGKNTRRSELFGLMREESPFRNNETGRLMRTKKGKPIKTVFEVYFLWSNQSHTWMVILLANS